MRCYQIPKQRIVYEVLSAEVIAIDFATGNYYALVHVAKVVWQCLEQGASVEAIAEALFEHRLCRDALKDRDAILQDLNLFVAELTDNHLIEPTDPLPCVQIALAIPPDWNYDPPQLQKYTDVQSLLLLDPIHEVSEAGWPAK
jgi:Coenzyme PQQ synthesis protein D (PqqD)